MNVSVNTPEATEAFQSEKTPARLPVERKHLLSAL